MTILFPTINFLLKNDQKRVPLQYFNKEHSHFFVGRSLRMFHNHCCFLELHLLAFTHYFLRITIPSVKVLTCPGQCYNTFIKLKQLCWYLEDVSRVQWGLSQSLCLVRPNNASKSAWPNTEGQDSAVHLNLQEKGRSSDSSIHIRGRGLGHNLSATYNTDLRTLPNNSGEESSP